MKPELIPYRVGHFDFMETSELAGARDGLESRLNSLLQTPHAQVATVKIQGRPAAILGTIPYFDGVVEVFSVINHGLVGKQPVAFHKLVKECLDRLKDQGVHRMQMYVKRDFHRGRKWAEALGFYEEAVLRQFGADRSDQVVYARVAN